MSPKNVDAVDFEVAARGKQFADYTIIGEKKALLNNKKNYTPLTQRTKHQKIIRNSLA